jgi:hypothetical protein
MKVPLEIQTGDRFVDEAGETGPRASTVRFVDKPGVRIPDNEKPKIEPPGR